jgi:hypothetical protein
MNKPPPSGPVPLGTRVATAIFCAIFMLAFGAGGLLAGVVPIVDTLYMAVAVRGWEPVSARMLAADLQTSRSSKGGTSYRATTRYAYRWQGRDLEGTRIGLARWGGADNIGDWQADWHARLSDALARQQPVAAWVDPDRPERAVLERRPRWGLLAFHGLFAVLFTPVGVGAGFAFVGALRGRALLGGRGARGDGLQATEVPVRRTAIIAGRLPPGLHGRLDAQGLQFVRWWPKVAGLVVAVLTAAWLLQALQDGAARGLGLVVEALLATLGLALALHLLSLRWRWRIEGGALQVERGSWLRRRQFRVSAAELMRLKQRVAFTSSTNGKPTVSHPRLELPAGAHLKPLVLTPALAGPEVAQWLLAQLQQALGAPRARSGSRA